MLPMIFPCRYIAGDLFSKATDVFGGLFVPLLDVIQDP